MPRSIGPIPRTGLRALAGKAASPLQAFREYMKANPYSEFVHDLLLGEAGDFLEDLSYGQTKNRIGSLAQGPLGALAGLRVDERALDALDVGGAAAAPLVALAKQAPRAVRAAARNAMVPRGASFEAGAIKPKGGNWRSYDRLGEHGTSKEDQWAYTDEAIKDLEENVGKYIKSPRTRDNLLSGDYDFPHKKLDEYFNGRRVVDLTEDEIGEFGDYTLGRKALAEWKQRHPRPVVGAASGLDTNLQSLLDSYVNAGAGVPGNPRNKALTEWTNKNLRRYLQTHWGSPDDPLADFFVAETRAGRAPNMGADGPDIIQGDFNARYGPMPRLRGPGAARVSEFDRSRGITEPDPRDFFTSTVNTLKAKETYPLQGPQTRGKREFEDTFKEYYHQGSDEPEPRFQAPSWAMKLDPDTPIHDLDIGPGGFHDQWGNELEQVFDYLRTLPPERIKNVSVPDAFRSAHEYHQRLRAKEQGGLGEALRGLRPVKEYPTGHRWVDLNDPEGVERYEGGYEDEYTKRAQSVGKALGHCYQHPETCRSYLANATLRTLIDEKGKPLVTVEIRRPSPTISGDRLIGNYGEEGQKAWLEYVALKNLKDERVLRDIPVQHSSLHGFLKDKYPKIYEDMMKDVPPSIHQIRATQNSAPTEDLYPFVQDLVKSGDWADVHEARNAGLFRMEDPFYMKGSQRRNFNDSLDRWINSSADEAEHRKRVEMWNAFNKERQAADPDSDPTDYIGEFLTEQGAKPPRPWKRPAAWVTAEDVLPYAKFVQERGTKNEKYLPLDQWQAGSRENALRMLQQLLHAGRHDEGFGARLEFPDDFEGFAKGGRVRARTSAYVPVAARAAAQHQLPAGLLEALIDNESGWNADAVSPKGAIGMAQLMPGTARELGVTDPRNPVDNIHGGAKYLRKLKEQFGTWDQALAAYNWGPGNLRKYGMEKLPRETRGYIGRVLAGLDMSALPSPAKQIIMSKLAAGEAPPPALPGMPSQEPDPTGGQEFGPGIEHDQEVEALLASLLDDEEELI